MWSGLTRSLKIGQEQSEEKNDLVITEDGRSDDETAESEVIINLPRMDPGTVSADAEHLIRDSIVDSGP